MIQKLYLPIVFGVFMISAKAQYPQDVIADSLLSEHLRIIDNSYDSITHNPNRFVTGKFYYPRGDKYNHPYFLDFNWKSGFVNNQGELFPVTMMKYDIENDVLVILEIIENLGYAVQLDTRVIKEFFIDGHHFEYIDDAKKEGYYERLYDSNTYIWSKWKKMSSNPVFGNPVYVHKTYYMVRKNNSYFEVNNLRDLMNAYSDKKQELKRFIKENKLVFRKDRAGTIKIIANQYDILNN